MQYFSEKIADKTVLNYDICIIGSGPAAFSFALQFENIPTIKVAILESSPFQFQFRAKEFELDNEFQVQNLYQGQVVGWLKNRCPDYLTASRLRQYGGTSVGWSGWCWTLDSTDFAKRQEDSNFWPIDYNELSYFYQKAQTLFGLDTLKHDEPQYWVDSMGGKKLAVLPSDDILKTRVLQFSGINFKENYSRKIVQSNNIDIYHNANLVSFVTSKTEGSVKQVTSTIIRTIKDGLPEVELNFSANHYVLAAGAIENTRLLLLSNFQEDNNQIGRNFIEHPYLWVGGEFHLNSNKIPEGIKNFYFPSELISTNRGYGVIASLVPTLGYLQEKKIGNFRILLGGDKGIPGTFNISCEQQPSQESQIDLSDEFPLDIFGQKRVRVQWGVCDKDRETIIASVEAARDFIEKHDYAEGITLPDFTVDPWDWEGKHQIMPGNHPMGTTRMSIEPTQGVVDTQCCLHGVKNLYVVGSSVFPTGGYANPTLTISALACRLASHLQEKY